MRFARPAPRETVGSTVADVSPYPPGHFHQALASVPLEWLQSELALRWAFGLQHAKEINQTPRQFATMALMSLLDDLTALGVKLPPEAKVISADLVDVVSGVVKALESAGVLNSEDAAKADSVDQTVGSIVADVQPGGDAQTSSANMGPTPDAPASPAAADPTPSLPAAAEPDNTIGSTVADITPGPAPSADPLAGMSVEQLTDELAKRQSEAVKAADAGKTQLSTEAS